MIEVTGVTRGFELKQVENVTDARAVANVRVSLILTATASGAFPIDVKLRLHSRPTRAGVRPETAIAKLEGWDLEG